MTATRTLTSADTSACGRAWVLVDQAVRGATLRTMGTELLPTVLLETYEVHETKHACAILHNDFPAEWQDIIEVLTEFRFRRSWILGGGGHKSKVASAIDDPLTSRGWVEKGFSTKLVVDGVTMDSPTHQVDCYRNRVALEIEWNNKDPFFDRDLNNFRLLFDLRAISVGVIVTRSDGLQTLFDKLAVGQKYGAATTHMSRLLRRINGGGGGGCPLLVFGITLAQYLEDN